MTSHVPGVPTPAQQEAIARTTELFRSQPEVLALFLGGSLAHGLGTAASDVDVMIVVPDAEWERRAAEGRTTFFDRDLCAYDAGYVDGKYVCPRFLAEVAARGSEPARFAFQDAKVLFARDATIPRLAAEIPRYPVAEKAARIARFHAQFEAWTWYAGEAFKKEDPWLVATSVSRLCLFAGRMVLAHNELLFPFHKWFLRVLERAPARPPRMVERIRALAAAPAPAEVTAFAEEVRAFRAWETGPAKWPVLFMRDTELDWMHGSPAVEAI
jgi:hypothetical protein